MHENSSVPLSEDETLIPLTSRFSLIQRRRGHRAATDDILLAWASLQSSANADRVLELGCGKGTVSLLLMSLMPEADFVGVEAFTPSLDIARRNAQLNGVVHRWQLYEGDIRSLRPDKAFHQHDTHPSAENEPLGQFPLIIGAPPFMPLGTGVLPGDPQRVVGRFEIRGGIEDYTATAARMLTNDGAAVLLMDGNSRKRTCSACRNAGLQVSCLYEVYPHPDGPCRFLIVRAKRAQSVFVTPGNPPPFWQNTYPSESIPTTSLTLRTREGGSWTPNYASIRQRLDLCVTAR